MTRVILSLIGDNKTKNKISFVFPFVISLITLLAVQLTVSAETTDSPWDLQISNLAEVSTLTFNELLEMPKTSVYGAIYCYGTLINSGEWTGVRLSDILARIGTDNTVRSINFVAKDGYVISISAETAIQPDVIIAYEKDNEPLSETYRLVVPWANGNIWIAMIDKIETSTTNVDAQLPQTDLMPGSERTAERIAEEPTNQPSVTPTPQASTPQPSQKPSPTPTLANISQSAIPPVNASVNISDQTPLQNNTEQTNSPSQLVYMTAILILTATIASLSIILRRRSHRHNIDAHTRRQ
jgi:DMSO/TMAO reductase YedYZ molybdopterin-dependent catalytic subunit